MRYLFRTLTIVLFLIACRAEYKKNEKQKTTSEIFDSVQQDKPKTKDSIDRRDTIEEIEARFALK